jgi:N-acyl-phosphatidylethanolamine-hydrolysing phospholipase D
MHVPPARITTLVWWEAVSHSAPSPAASAVRIVLTPAQHSSRRGFFDSGVALHGGFAVETSDARVYVVGDSGYVPGLFAEVGRLLGPFDLGVIPIGAYAPRDLHAVSHMDPTDAMRVHAEARCRRSVAVHWGTFRLTTEDVFEPRDLLEARKAELLAEGRGGAATGAPEAFSCVLPGQVTVALR